tara:strand:- start:6494 stop:7234 length:741 start_codon:yes stop_codon:yes gene_type:complete
MKYVTFTTNGSVELCKNFILSAGKVGIQKDLIVYCLDKESKEQLSNEFDCDFRLYELEEIKDIHHAYGENQFRRVTEAKIEIIIQALDEFDTLVYSDCDIVFRKDPTPVIEYNDKDGVDITFASDEPFMHICTGFMLIKNTESVRRLFVKYYVLSNQYEAQGSKAMYDQEIINYILNSEWMEDLKDFAYGVYPTDFIKNGHLFWNEPTGRTNEEYVIHVNYTVGKESKINRLKEANLWYVEEGTTQ